MTTVYYESFGLHDTVRVGIDGAVTHGMKVPHEAANLPCSMLLPTGLVCKKRAGHAPGRGQKRHTPIDTRIVASPRRIVHTERFKPNTMPKGLDMTITAPHDCASHLEEPGDDRMGAPLRGR